MQTEFFKQITDNLTTSVLLLNNALVLDYINPAGEILFEISAKRIVGNVISEIFLNTEQMIDGMNNAMLTGQGFTERELQLSIPGARSINVDCIVTPISDNTYPDGIIIELIQMDRHLRISREGNLLAQHELALSTINGLAHEIKNPLGGLRGAAQLLERELPDASLKEFTEIIIGEADRLQNLVDRMQGAKTLPKMKKINIHQVIERVRTLVSAEVPDGVTLTRDYDPSIPDLLADQDQLIQAILNIVKNATQAVTENQAAEKQGNIILRTRAVRQFTIGQTIHKLVLRIDIIDDGPGIPDDIIESIFYPMVTGRAEGTGLGLSISQSLVNQHGGLIECTSEPGLTTFSILLPLQNI